MKRLLLVGTAIWFWCCVMNVSAVTKPSMMILQEPTDQSNQKLGFHRITLDLDKPTTNTYRDFMVEMRAALRGDRVVCSVPVLRETATIHERFVLVDLIITSEITVTVAIDVLDVYVVGYLDKLGERPRANFLKDIPEVGATELFKELHPLVRFIPFSGTYRDLEDHGVVRVTVPLGLDSLQASAMAVYGVERPNPRDEAKFLITAVEMISEAARFKYIGRLIRSVRPSESILPNQKVLTLANEWGAISKAILGSPDCVVLRRPVVLCDADNNRWVITNVSEILPDISIIKHISHRVRAVQVS